MRPSGRLALTDQQDEDRIVNRVVRRIADEYGCTIDEVKRALDRHPIEVDRDNYLKRALPCNCCTWMNWKKPFVTRPSSIVTSLPVCF